MNITELFSYINDFGVLGMFALILVLGMRQVWVWGWTYLAMVKERDDMVKERDEWKRIALQNYKFIETTTDVIVRK